MTISVDGWAVVNRQGRLMLHTVRRYKETAIRALIENTVLPVWTWEQWQEYGFKLCRVSIRELEETEHEKT